MNLPQITKISSQQMKKIFPFKYYKKYAEHQAIVSYQSQAIKSDNNFQKSNIIRDKRKARIDIPEIGIRKQYNPKYENFEAIIEINKEQTLRLNKFNKALTLKLQVTPQKKPNTIRSPLKQNFQAEEDVLNRLKAIEDSQYERILNLRYKNKQQLEKNNICKFVPKIRSTKISPRKSSQLDSNLPNPELPRTISAIQTIKQQMTTMERHHSKSLAQLSQIQAKRKILRDKKSMKSQNSSSQNIQTKRDLIFETMKLKKQVRQMETISYFESLASKKKHRKLLQAL